MYQLWFGLLTIFVLAAAQPDQRTNLDGTLKNENIIEEQQKFVTLGPIRNGTQRAVFDEVIDNNVEAIETDIAVNPADEFGGYDDNLVELNEERDIFIPKQYRVGDKSQEKSSEKKEDSQEKIEQSNLIGSAQPSGPGQLKSIEEQVPQQPAQPVQPPPAFPERVHDKPGTIPSLQITTPEAPRTRLAASPVPQATASPQRPTTRPLVPVRSPIRGPAIRKQDTAANLRTGKCSASIFYISSPSPPKPRITFSHFAMTVSVDQCARTCHEFNCAIAHYDPRTGRCQFNPSTAFVLKEGQCPAWPGIHYRNNVVTPQPLRIFCVQCHRPRTAARMVSPRKQRIGGRYRTRFLKTQYTGRLPQALQGTTFAKVHAASHPLEALTENITSGIFQGQLIRQPQSSLVQGGETRENMITRINSKTAH